jgi:hypothetical protein
MRRNCAHSFYWRREEEFERELRREMVLRSAAKSPELIDSLSDIAIRDGNAAMAKLALQNNGMLTDKVEIEQTNRTEASDADSMRAEIERFRKRKEESHVQ